MVQPPHHDEIVTAPGGSPVPAEQGPSANGRPNSPDGAPTVRGARRRWLALVVIAAAQLVIVLDATLLTVALPTITADLGISTANRAWVITAYTVAFGGLLLLGDRVADRLGRKRMFLLGLTGFAAASALGGLAQNLATLASARAGQGAFAALLAPAALALLGATFTDPTERRRAFAVFGAVAGGGAAMGLVLGGVLTDHAGWRWVFYVNVPVAVVAVAAAVPLLGESRQPGRGRLDIGGALLGTGGLAAVVYGLAEAQRVGWTEPGTLALIGVGLSALILFVTAEALAPNPLLPLRILAERNRAGANLAVLAGMVGLFGLFFLLTFYLQQVLSYSPMRTGAALLPTVGGIVAAAVMVGPAATRIPPRWLMSGGLFAAAAGLGLLSRLEAGSGYATDVVPGLVLIGVGLGCAFVPAFDAANSGVVAADAGVAGVTVNAAEQVGAAVGVGLLSTIAANRSAEFLVGREDSGGALVSAQAQGTATAAAWAAWILAAAGLAVLALVNARPVSRPASGRVAGPAAAQPAYRTRGSTGSVPVGSVSTGSMSAGSMSAGSMSAGSMPTGPVSAGSVPAGVGSPSGERVNGGPSPVVLTGRVRHPGGAPAPAAVLTLLDASGAQIARADGQPDGTFHIDVHAAGRYTLVVRRGGHQPVALTVTAVEHGRPVDVVLGGSAALFGTVRTAGGPGGPVPEATLTLTDVHGDALASTRTDAGGAYAIPDLAGGAYTLVVTTLSSHPTAVAVAVAEEGGTRCDVDLVGSAGLAGVARAGGRPVADARVTLREPGGETLAVVHTDVEGRFTFADLAEGDYTVVAAGYPAVTETVRLSPGHAVERDIDLAYPDVEQPAALPARSAASSRSAGSPWPARSPRSGSEPPASPSRPEHAE